MERKNRNSHSLRSMLLHALLLAMAYAPLHGYAQPAYRGTLHNIRQTGYHKIMITPDITAKSKADLSDLRILSEEGQQVPYMLKRSAPFYDGKEIRNYPVIGHTTNDSISELVLETPTAYSNPEEAHSLALVINNAAALRQGRISGSNDRSNWYAMIDNIILGNSTGGGEHTYLQLVTMPSNSYRYIRISVFNRGLPPLDITHAGMVQNRYIQGAYDVLPAPAIVQQDSADRKSYVTFSFGEPYPISKLKWELSGAALYKRKARMYDAEGRLLGETSLTPETDTLLLSGKKEKVLQLVIENNDDTPLNIRNATAWQLQQYLIADLAAGKRYFIETGNEKAAAPVYDLPFFSEKITLVEEVLTPDLLERLHIDGKQNAAEKMDKRWLWIFIIIALVLLLLLSNRLLQHIGKNNNDRS